MTQYVDASLEEDVSNGKTCGCTVEGTQALFDFAQAFDKNNQFYIHISMGRFSWHWENDMLRDGRW